MSPRLSKTPNVNYATKGIYAVFSMSKLKEKNTNIYAPQL